MIQMRIKVVGKKHLGKYLIKELSRKSEVNSHNIKKEVREGMSKVYTIVEENPDVIVNTKFVTDVDLCEIAQNLVFSVGVGPLIEDIDYCKKNKKKLVYISSIFVKDPVNVYSKMKLLCEEMIQKELEDYLIIRTDTMYSKERTFNWEKGAVDVACFPTNVEDLAVAIKVLIYLNKKGIIDVTGYQKFSKYEFIRRLSNPNVKPVKVKDLKLMAKRSKNIHSDVDAAKDIGLIMREI